MFFTELTDIPSAHVEHTTSALHDGSVLVTGGCDQEGEAQATCVRFKAGHWRQAAPLPAASRRHSATPLQDGTVLVVGVGDGQGGAALYDPARDAWGPVSAPDTPRVEHAAALLSDGRVLICGGRDAQALAGLEGPERRAVPALDSCEIFDPRTLSWSDGPRLAHGRRKHQMMTLTDGGLLVVGGKSTNAQGQTRALKTAELADAALGSWQAAGKTDPAERHLIVLDDGRVLGCEGGLFDPRSGRWTEVEACFRGGGPMCLLADHRVVCFGARGEEVFDPRAGQWTPCGEPQRLQRRGHHAVSLQSGALLVVGGSPGRRRGLPLAQLVEVDLEPDALVLPESALEPSGAEELLKMLVDNDKLELEDDADLGALAEQMDRLLRFGDNAGAKAQGLSRLLLNHDDVVDFYLEDRELRQLLQRW